jgi:flavodoxin
VRSVVIYHSRFGNTERIARAVAEGLSERGEARVVALSDLQPLELETAHLVVLGGPARMKGVPLSVRRFLRRLPRDFWFGRPVAVFDTRFRDDQRKTGSAAERLSDRLQQMGALTLVSPESFFVTGMEGPPGEGEIVRARLWGRHLHLSDRVCVEGE